ncbi:uncharacterized aarF domain-containing protein kinase 2-like [Physella acuta]|uniref:uncharacterized aarF domain-containing protein kinase 2-like n=1 Tax=Physella acuta TaxID=109671 RepID=UPI0027DDD082|nr:uncharacterized aarF domain-containing protein kinase 2-like [Physella acuta]
MSLRIQRNTKLFKDIFNSISWLYEKSPIKRTFITSWKSNHSRQLHKRKTLLRYLSFFKQQKTNLICSERAKCFSNVNSKALNHKLLSFQKFSKIFRCNVHNLRFYMFTTPLLVLCLELNLNKTGSVFLCVANCESAVPSQDILTGVHGLPKYPDVEQCAASNWIAFKDSFLLYLRAAHLICVFFPLLIGYPLIYLNPWLFNQWLKLLYMAVERLGATFIKLGQWASTRRDIFSKEFCDKFSNLHHRVHPHSWWHTEKSLERAYGKNWNEIITLDKKQEPIGSGCIGQVYKGFISSEFIPSSYVRDKKELSNKHIKADNANGRADAVFPVAIKILHPDVVKTFERDLRLMKSAAKYLTKLFPKLHWANLNQCVEEFAVTMRKQLDMGYEYRCLEKFTSDFASCDNIRVPQPIKHLLRKNILVETFEEGICIGNILRDSIYPEDVKIKLAKIGIDALFQMVFVNNFVHADLHPGNILVQNLEYFREHDTSVSHNEEEMMPLTAESADEHPLRLVLLDCGITATLTSEDKQKFREVFTAVVKGEGEAVADLFLFKSAVNLCSNPELFRKEMAGVVSEGRKNLKSISKIKVAELMNEVFNVLARHKIQLEASFATIILAIAMLEGLGRSLDPNLDLLDKAKYVLLGSFR